MSLLAAVVIIAVGAIFKMDLSYYLVFSAAIIADKIDDLVIELRKHDKQ